MKVKIELLSTLRPHYVKFIKSVLLGKVIYINMVSMYKA